MEKPDEVTAAWESALAADRPCVLDFVTDPAVPPIPPHASLEQIEAAASSVLKGDSDRAAMVRQGFKAKIQDLLPGDGPRAVRDVSRTIGMSDLAGQGNP